MSLLNAKFPSDCGNMKELIRASLGEFIAMTLFIFFGLGSVAATGEFLTQDGIARENTVSGRLFCF
jgi:glycerol uptake facilitator-like aquaporin